MTCFQLLKRRTFSIHNGLLILLGTSVLLMAFYNLFILVVSFIVVISTLHMHVTNVYTRSTHIPCLWCRNSNKFVISNHNVYITTPTHLPTVHVYIHTLHRNKCHTHNNKFLRCLNTANEILKTCKKGVDIHVYIYGCTNNTLQLLLHTTCTCMNNY